MSSKLIPTVGSIGSIRTTYAEEVPEARLKKDSKEEKKEEKKEIKKTEEKKIEKKEEKKDESGLDGIDELENMLDDQLSDFKKEAEKKEQPPRLGNNKRK